MPALTASGSLGQLSRPARYRSLQTLLLLIVLGSLVSSIWLMPSRVERIVAATERGDDALVEHELEQSAQRPGQPGETRALVDVALTRGDPEAAAAILQQSLARQPDSVAALRLLLEVERQRHRMREVAALDERIYAITGEADALREAADIYGSQNRTPERVDALRRLNAIGHATASDVTELAHRLSDAGAGRDALELTMAWLEEQTGSVPPEIVALAAGLSATGADATAFAKRLGALIGRAGEREPLDALVQTYAERGRPELSLIAGDALGEPMQARPGVALLLAQLEAQQGDFASARRRLSAVERAGNLLPAALPILADLDIQMGDLERAVGLIGKMTPDQIIAGLPHRLVEAAYARGQIDVLRGLSLAPLVAVSPGSGAVVALARGDRKQAETLALTALAPGAGPADLGPAFGWTLRTLGLGDKALTRLTEAARAGALTDDGFALLLDLASSAPAASRALVGVLRDQRERSAPAAAAWAVLATRQGNGADVARWLRADGTRLPTGALLNLMLAAHERRDAVLSRLTGELLSRRADLPDGWTPAEIAFTSTATDPLSTARLRDGLKLIGSPALGDAARNRVVASVIGARGFLQAAAGVEPSLDSRSAIDWLARGSGSAERAEAIAARLSLLTSVAPKAALEALALIWTDDPERLMPLYATALLRTGRVREAETVLDAGLQRLAIGRQDAVLYDILARVPKSAALPVLRFGARSGRPDWIAALDEGLQQAGLLDELRADLRARASAIGLDPTRREAIASRLVELDDRLGAIAVLKSIPAGMRPDDPGIQQLVYLWGPRGSADAIAWLRERAMAAPLAELPKWLDTLAYVGAPRAVIELVERHPGVLGADALATRLYGTALVVARETPRLDLAGALPTAKTADALLALAQLALDTGQPLVAWRAATAAVSKAPNDAAALLLAGQTAASIHRSAEAAEFYSRLLARGPQSVEVAVDAGDALLTARRNEVGREVLLNALARLPSHPGLLAEARLRARTLVLLRRSDEAAALLSVWLNRYPEHSGLKADLLQIRTTGERSAW